MPTCRPPSTIAPARDADLTIEKSQRMARGDAAAALAASPPAARPFAIGGQDHFYLEGQVALAIPGEGGDVHVWSSTQHPSEVQHLVARVLDVPHTSVTIEVRRMGGGFGGKETQASLFAAGRRPGRGEDRSRRQGSARPRRGHGHDRQAA
jgi:xanthine dehydrogenase large subunit